jgi:hypothetical protein
VIDRPDQLYVEGYALAALDLFSHAWAATSSGSSLSGVRYSMSRADWKCEPPRRPDEVVPLVIGE